MTDAAAHLRREANTLRLAARGIWRESEALLERATRLNEEAARLDQLAEEEEDIAEVSARAGRQATVRRGRVRG